MIITLVCSFFVSWIGLPVIYLLFSRNKPRQKRQSEEKPHHVTPSKLGMLFYQATLYQRHYYIVIGSSQYLLHFAKT